MLRLINSIAVILFLGITTTLQAQQIGDPLQLFSYEVTKNTKPDVTDGQIAPASDPTDWKAAYVRVFQFAVDGDPANQTRNMTLLIGNDGDSLYIAAAVELPNASVENRMRFYFDHQPFGSLTGSEDAPGEYYIELFANDEPPKDGHWNGSAWIENTEIAAIGMGIRKGVEAQSRLYNFEFQMPLNKAGDSENSYLELMPGDRIGVLPEILDNEGNTWYWTQTNSNVLDPSATNDATGMTGWGNIRTIGEGVADRDLATLAARHLVPTIDGNVSGDDNWKYAFKRNVFFTDFDGNIFSGDLKIKEQRSPDNILFGLRLHDLSPAAGDHVTVYFDQGSGGGDRDFILSPTDEPIADDASRVMGDGSYRDLHFDGTNWVEDGTFQGEGAASLVSNAWEVEMSVPMASGDNQNLNIESNDVIGVLFRYHDSQNDRDYWWSATINTENIQIDPVDGEFNALGWGILQTGGPFVQPIYPEDRDTLSGEYPLAVYTVDPGADDPKTGIESVQYEIRRVDLEAGTFTTLITGDMSKVEDDDIPIWTATLNTRQLNVSPTEQLRLVYIVDNGVIDPVSAPLDIYINNESEIVDIDDPTININEPAPNSVLSGGSVEVAFTATTNERLTIDTVEVYIDGNLMETYLPAETSTYNGSYIWDTTDFPDGEHIIQVRAVNSMELANFSPSVLVTTQNAPVVSLTYPAASDTVQGMVTVQFDATPVAPNTLANAEISINGDDWFSATELPPAEGGEGSFDWNTGELGDGNHSLQVRVTDNTGKTGYSSTIKVSTLNTPTAIITAPLTPRYHREEVEILFSAAPVAPNTLAAIEISIDGGEWNAVSDPPDSEGGEGSHLWDTRDVKDGTHSVIIRAKDSTGKTGYSNTVNIQVDNTAPAGPLSVLPDEGKNGDTFTFTYLSSERNLTVTITQDELQKLDSTVDTDLQLEYIEAEGIYAASHTVSMENENTDGVKSLTATATDEAGNNSYPEVAIFLDNTAPSISLTVSPVPSNGDGHNGEVYEDEIILSGSYYDLPDTNDVDEIVLSVKNTSGQHINNSPLTIEINSSRQFSRRLNLVEGENMVRITMQDRVGNVTEEEFVLTYIVPKRTQVIGPAGGIVNVPDGTTITIPEGALQETIEITTQHMSTGALPMPLDPDVKLIDRAFEFGPSGTVFYKPVTITFSYNQSDLDINQNGSPDFSEEALDVFFWDGSTWIKITPQQRNTEENTVTITTNHFSIYTLGNTEAAEEFTMYWTKNPFDPQEGTTAVLDAPQSGSVQLRIYDLSGNLVRTIADNDHISGSATYRWDGQNDFNRYVGSGIYIYLLEYDNVSNDKTIIRKPIGIVK